MNKSVLIIAVSAFLIACGTKEVAVEEQVEEVVETVDSTEVTVEVDTTVAE